MTTGPDLADVAFEPTDWLATGLVVPAVALAAASFSLIVKGRPSFSGVGISSGIVTATAGDSVVSDEIGEGTGGLDTAPARAAAIFS